MAGVSLTLTWLDDELERHWTAPSDAPVLRRGAIIVTEPAPPLVEDVRKVSSFPPASARSRDDGRCIAGVLTDIASALRAAEDELGRIDAIAGDGDHGQGMTRGSAAAAEAATEAVAALAGAASVLAAAGDAWADRAGGTSGALWGLALRTWSGALSDTDALDAPAVARGARDALAAIVRLGRGRVGDKTLVDAFDPFVATLTAEVERGQSLASAWNAAAVAATRAAEATAGLAPKLGRARPHAARSVGHPDAGAVSLALCARTIGDAIAK
jgi:dihydroxyacetone kinase